MTLKVEQYTDQAGVVHININHILTGGLKGTEEKHILDWQPRQYDDHVFGTLKAQGRRVTSDDIEDPFQREGWSDDEVGEGPGGELHIEASAVAEKGWTASQIWGMRFANSNWYTAGRKTRLLGASSKHTMSSPDEMTVRGL